MVRPGGQKHIPRLSFAAGRAEAIPLRDASVDAIAAAGSLNYADVYRFFEEAARLLTVGGVSGDLRLLHGPGVFRDSDRLDRWFAAFRTALSMAPE